MVGHWEELVYTDARLSAHPAAKTFTADLKPLFKRLADLEQGQREAWRTELSAQAAVDAVDDSLDDATRDLQRQLVFLDGKRSARLKRYFARELSRYVAYGLQTQATAVQSWPASLKQEEEGVLKALGSTFARLLKEAGTVLQARADALGATADHRAKEILSFAEDHNRVRLSIHAALTTMAMKNGLPRDFGDRFFRRDARTAVAEPAAEPEAPATPV